MVQPIFEEMGGRYERQGEYILPCLTIPPEKEQSIDLFGRRHLTICGSTAKLHTPIFSQAAGSMLTLPTLTDRHRNTLNGS